MRARLICTAALLLVACQPSQVQFDRNIVVSDSSGLIDDISWGRSPAVDDPFFPEGTYALLLEAPEPNLIEIAVNGSTGCPPLVDATISGEPDALRVELVLSESIPSPGTECPEDLTTYALELRTSEAIDHESIELLAEPSDPKAPVLDPGLSLAE